jgi:nucleoid-associated protein YgaU
MKYYNKVAALAFILLFAVGLVAQQRDLSTDEWEAEMKKYTEAKENAMSEKTSLETEISGLKAKQAELQSYDACMDELYQMVGASKADVANFATKVAQLELNINNKTSPKKDRQAELDLLKANKISALPQFFDKVHNQLQRALDAWMEKPAEVMYTVVKGDCLWNIAKKKDHYGNGFAWPKIYNANKDKIKDPDLIFPKQVFKVPNLTEEEQAKYEKLRKNYKPAPMP